MRNVNIGEQWQMILSQSPPQIQMISGTKWKTWVLDGTDLFLSKSMMSIRDENIVFEKWKEDFEHLYSCNTNNEFDQTFYDNLKCHNSNFY